MREGDKSVAKGLVPLEKPWQGSSKTLKKWWKNQQKAFLKTSQCKHETKVGRIHQIQQTLRTETRDHLMLTCIDHSLTLHKISELWPNPTHMLGPAKKGQSEDFS